jgi:hypothetical protein
MAQAAEYRVKYLYYNEVHSKLIGLGVNAPPIDSVNSHFRVPIYWFECDNEEIEYRLWKGAFFRTVDIPPVWGRTAGRRSRSRYNDI